MQARSFEPTMLLPTTAHRCSSLATQSGSMSSILSLFDSTTLSNSAVFRMEKYRNAAPSGTSFIRYMPASKRLFSVGTMISSRMPPSASVNREPTRLLPGTLGNLTRL